MMKFKFYITNVHNNLGLLSHYIVYSRLPGEASEHYLVFETYDLAERWIEDQRKNGDKSLYQIQKIYE